MLARGLKALSLLILSVVLVGCDHAAKLAASELLAKRSPVRLVDGVLSLTYTENRDVGFRLLRMIPEAPRFWVMLALGAGAVALMIAALRSRLGRASRAERAAYALLIGGGLGNLLDRVLRGYVIDFVHVRYWPVFNLADVFLVAGVGLLLLVRLRRRSPNTGTAP